MGEIRAMLEPSPRLESVQRGKRRPASCPNLQRPSTTSRFGSRYLRRLNISAHDWGQLLMFQGKSCSLRRAFTNLLYGQAPGYGRETSTKSALKLNARRCCCILCRFVMIPVVVFAAIFDVTSSLLVCGVFIILVIRAIVKQGDHLTS